PGEISGAPVMAVNAREADRNVRQDALQLLLHGKPAPSVDTLTSQQIPVINLLTEVPQQTIFEHRRGGRPAAIICLFLLLPFRYGVHGCCQISFSLSLTVRLFSRLRI
nr:hypothetical protein [Klebsiella pneumoniae]